MPNSSETAFRIAYFVDTFPRRTENFILREIAGVLAFWPDLRVYCFHSHPEDWPLVDCGAGLSRTPCSSIILPFVRAAWLHLRWVLRSPARYLHGFRSAVRLHGSPMQVPRAMRRFDQALRLAELARRDAVTHLHAHFASVPATVCHLAAGMLGIGYSLSAHAADLWTSRPFEAVIRDATACLACTAEGRDYLLREFPGAHVHLVHHWLAESPDPATSVPGRVAARPSPRPVLIVSGGRFVAKKGFDILIDACALLRQRDVAFACDIYGEGELEEALRAQVRALGLGSQVQIHGFIPHSDFHVRLAESHLCVLACRRDPVSGDHDGIPNVLLEAVSCGAILVASGLPTLREFVEDGLTGYLFEPENPVALADTVERSLREEATWDALRERARRLLSEEFGRARNLLALRDLIEKPDDTPEQQGPSRRGYCR